MENNNDWTPFYENDETETGLNVKRARAKEFQCPCGWKGKVDVRGRPQKGYWKDANGKSWFLYWVCPNKKCGNELTLDKIWLKNETK